MKKRVLLIAALGVIAAEPFLFWDAFAGDAQVHLTFMQNAASGRFFEFNPGEPVSGETSPGYMILGAALFKVLTPAAIPIALKIVNLLAWYAFCWFVFRAAQRLLAAEGDPERRWPATAAFVAATLVGSVYNANVGMENGLFAALIWGWLLYADRRGWFEGTPDSYAGELLGALLLGLSVWVRPEGWVVALTAYAFRLTRRPAHRLRLLLGLITVFAVGGASVAFQYVFTKDVVATSILSRRVLAMPDLVGLGQIRLDPKFAARLLTYLPLTAFLIWGLRSAADAWKGTGRFLQVLFGVFFAAYTLTGTPHLTRYVIFLLPILVIGAMHGARTVWRRPRTRALIVGGALGVVAVNVIELRQRREHYSSAELAIATKAPAKRRERTDRLLAVLEDPDGRPAVVATESVQLRYEVDDRIVVRSLDGRVDRTLLAFVHEDVVDHVGYLKARDVDYLLQTKTYNRTPVAWSLAELRGLTPGQTLLHDGLSFRRLAGCPCYQLGMP